MGPLFYLLSVSANCKNRTNIKGPHTFINFLGIGGLLKDIGVAANLVHHEETRCFHDARITGNTLVINIEDSRYIVWPSIVFVSQVGTSA
ncbi:MAG: hypothetical protein A2X86_07475 [Bdellovibrionales bacterium GWA2_49_15]|nr:MAG: hypothetical protein A2X86_07475 [Bdellovibrionales bacterium GWA2_49_15]